MSKISKIFLFISLISVCHAASISNEIDETNLNNDQLCFKSNEIPTQNIDGELNYSAQFMEQMLHLYSSPNNSDVTFVVDDVKLPAHKFILTVRSSYFAALLDAGFSESTKNEIELKVPLEAFKQVLRYIYTGCVSLRPMDSKTIFDLLSLADEYSMEELKSGIASYLMGILSLNNCCDSLEAARLYELTDLEDASYTFFDENAIEMMKIDEFKTLTSGSLHSLLERSTFRAPEVEIFKAVVEWRESNQNISDDDFQKIVSAIRFELIDLEDLFSIVRNASIMSEARFIDILKTKTVDKKLNYRTLCKPKINVASPELGAKVIVGTNPSKLLRGNYAMYDANNGYTSHNISASEESCIIVELKNIFMINSLDLLLWDKDLRSYSYYVEVSTNQEQWKRVIDHTAFACRSWQRLYFETHAVRYVKLVGTNNTSDTIFQVVHFAARYLEDRPTLINGLIAPVSNVALKEQSAKVIEGLHTGSDVDAVLNGDFINYMDENTHGYTTCNSLGEGIIIQLAQPYYIGSMRLLLWDKEDITYSFYIETSTDKGNWTMAVDKRNEQLRSWQEFRFDARPIVFIRITGTNSSTNNYLLLVHLEAPNNMIAIN